MSAASISDATDRRAAIVASFVELVHAHYRGEASKAVTASAQLQRFGVTVHLAPRPLTNERGSR